MFYITLVSVYNFSNNLLIMVIVIMQVVGVPVTLNGDLKNQFVETNVGFDTISKVYFLSG